LMIPNIGDFNAAKQTIELWVKLQNTGDY